MKKIFNLIVDFLPNYSSNAEIWSDSGCILCLYKEDVDKIVDFLSIFNEEAENIATGYYDSYEDMLNGETDKFTGYWYIDIA